MVKPSWMDNFYESLPQQQLQQTQNSISILKAIMAESGSPNPHLDTSSTGMDLNHQRMANASGGHSIPSEQMQMIFNKLAISQELKQKLSAKFANFQL